MAASEAEIHQQCLERFINLANQMKNEGLPARMVSAALMTASGVYATYTAAGNEGGLTRSGVDKVASAYRQSLENIQQSKREQRQRANG